jgi:calpain-15
MAEVPARVQARFYTKEVNSAGIYLVSFFINGTETPIIIDEHIPVRHNKPCFSSSRVGELWVLLLEKAWAKIQGSYARTESGMCSDAVAHVMGVPSKNIFHDDLIGDNAKIEKFWDKIKIADKRNFTMMAASHGSGEVENA